jgi:hexosaminidase
MDTKLNLLPAPRHLQMTGGMYALTEGRLILLDGPHPSSLRFAAERFEQALLDRFDLNWHIVASQAVPRDQIALTLRVTPDRAHSEGYELVIAADGITLEARDDAGIFYGVCTLIQVVDASPLASALPTLHIIDWPDFPVRGVMLDISRDKVPTLETTLSLVDLLASWKVNQFQLYTEHTFAYRHHPEVWAHASPFTAQEIMELDAYCRARHVELVPNQNSFGHLEHWLKLPRYKPLAEAPDGFDFPWGHHDGPFSLCPADPRSLDLVRGLFDELLPHFSSRMFNVGCDETFDVGQGRSKDEVAKRGAGRVYLDFLLKVYDEVKVRGHTMQFWGDIIVEHPDLIPELPKDSIALEWGYEAHHPFDEHGAKFAAAGIPFYVCPGTASWCSIAGRTDNARGNLLNAAENGLKHGATGYLNTDWGDRGHWQVLPVSYIGLAMGAAYSWALEANRNMDVPGAVSLHAFRDPSGVMGRVAYDLGNAYQAVGFVPHNSSVLFWVLQRPLGSVPENFAGLSPASFKQALKAIDHAMRGLSKHKMQRPDADLIVREYENTAHLLRHAGQRGLLAFEQRPAKAAALRHELAADLREIIREYKRLWLARNRPGGLADSVAHFDQALQDYRKA